MSLGEEISDDREAIQVRWVFHHLPKTAGSSIVEEFQAILSPHYTIFVPQEELEEARDYHGALDAAFLQFMQSSEEVDYRFISGHFFRRHVQWFANSPNTRIFTFVRDPLRRLISEYRYQQTPVSGDWEGFLERYPSFDHFLKDRTRHNIMSRAIAGKGASGSQAVDIVRRNYFFCGTSERYDESVSLLLRLAGGDSTLQARSNVTPAKVPQEVPDPERYRAVVTALNMADAELYQFARENIDRALERLSGMIADHAV